MSETEREPRAVLVTGASGYLGKLVVEAIAGDRRGLSTVVAMDLREPPTADRSPGVDYLAADIRDVDLDALIAERSIDTIVHLAAVMNADGKTAADLAYEVEVTGTERLLDACVRAKARKLIVTSSGAAYGYHADNRPLLTEDCPLRGNEEFTYAKHKRLIEEMLARYRSEHPELQQLVFRPGTVLGEATANQITALFEKPVILGLKGVATPFVFIWDRDVVNCIVEGVHGPKTGIYNLAGDGVMTLREIAAALNKRFLPIPVPLLSRGLELLKRFDLTRYGPEQVRFLQYRPVLSNERLKREFGYTPTLTSREVFELYRKHRPRG